MLPDHVTRPFRLYAVFRGRSTRREYWFFAAAGLVALFAAVGVGAALDGTTGKNWTVALYALVALALAPPALALRVRRLHDIDLSGWWMLAVCVPVIGIVVDLFIGLKSGSPGENSFGSDPRDAAETVD
jgi:uncharacterized membrane protein YhaH (DUF805 family)